MALRQPRPWLVAYDIRDPARLGRVHRFLKRHAVPVQYSVFIRWCSPADAQRLGEDLRALIDERHDDVRIYGLPESPDLFCLGKRMLPDDSMLLGEASLLELTGPRAAGRRRQDEPSPTA